MQFKFIHTADIHLDSPLRGLQQYEGAPVEYIRAATRKAFKNLIDLGIAEKVNFILIAGDLYDGDWRDYNTGLFFSSQMARLNEAGIRVFVVRGNHDAASRITKQLRLPANVTDFSTDSPETVCIEDIKVAIHGQGFTNQSVTENLSRSYPDSINEYFNIGLLHTCLNGREGHENYAPCDINYLESKGYSYWALGHVHNREVIREDPWIVFPGNIQGRHIRETGEKGCTVVEVTDGRVTMFEHRNLDVLRWASCEIDISGAGTEEEIIKLAEARLEDEVEMADGRLLATRLIIKGASRLHNTITGNPEHLRNNLRAMATDLAYDRLWIEKIKIRTKNTVDRDKILENHPVESLLRFIRKISEDEEIIEELKKDLDDLMIALPSELFKEDTTDIADDDVIRQLLPDIEDLIITRLAGEMEEVSADEI